MTRALFKCGLKFDDVVSSLQLLPTVGEIQR